MKTEHTVNAVNCSGCGVCVEACPAHILQLVDSAGRTAANAKPDRSDFCIRCGNCMALCKTRSIEVEGLTYEKHFFALEENRIDGQALEKLFASRRSVRVFRPDPVPREALEKIAELITSAPMSFTPHKVELSIVSKREAIEQALPIMVQTYERLGRLLENPFARLLLKLKLNPEAFALLRGHLMPTMRYRLPETKAGEYDTITRGASAIILFHARPKTPKASVDAPIALTYGLLAAHALGLGAAAIDLVPPVVSRSPELKVIFGVPPENVVHSSMILGYPKHRFRRGIRRQMAGVTWI